MRRRADASLAAVLVAAVLCAGCVSDTRPYEFVDARRETDEIAPWIDFETETGWRAEAKAGGFAAAERCDERQLFGKKVLRLRYRGARDVRLRPAEPLEIPAAHEWFSAWIWNDQSNYSQPKKESADYGIVLVDAQGRETRMPFRRNGYDKVMGWMDWTWMAKRFSPEELKVLETPRLRFDGFYVSGVTDDEMRTAYFDNLAFFTRDESRPLELAKVQAVGVPTRSEGACPLSKADGSRNETAVADGVTTFSYIGADGRLDYFWRGTPDTLEASWNGGARFRPCRGAGAKTNPEAASYEARLDGKTLVVDVQAPAGEEYVSMGRPDGARILSRSAVGCLADGYEWEDSRSLVTALDDGTSRFFTLTFGDWYVSDASALTFHADAAGVTNCAAVYRPKTDGLRNPVRERLYVTVSPDFVETLPVIANPTSVWKKVTGSHAWCAYASSADRSFDKAFWRNLHGLGVRKVVINDHECCMRDGGESFTFREKAAPGKGGDAGLRDWTDFLVNELHYRYGPYNNFTDFAPVNANWRFDRACREPSESFYSCGEVKHCSGGLTPAWMRNYGPKPQWAYEACRHYAPILEEKFGFNTAYCDVHTAVYPWIYCDFDARCEGAGKFRTVFNAYCAILKEQKRNWNGPVYSEGGCQYLYAGHVDGNYAQVRLNPDKDPWIVDFDLRRIHPLECDFGMGNLDMFTATPKDPKDPVLPEMLDRFLAATLAFGHAPYLCVDAMFSPRQHHGFGYALGSAKYDPVAGLPLVLRSYFMVRPAAERYSLATAEEILYLGADGTWRDVSAAVLSGDRKMNRIAVRYSDGTCVVANGDRELRLKATAFGRNLDLPPTGYAVWTADGSLEIESSDRFGSRVDYSASPEAVFLDTRAAKDPVVFPRARGKGRAVRFRDGDGWKTVVLEGQVEFEDEKRAFGVPRPQDADFWWRALKSHEYVRCLLPDTVDLVLVGDSITAGWGGALAGGWFKRLRQDYTVHNLGVGSDRCEHILWRMENGELDGYRAKAVMVLAGTNNLDEPVEDVIASVSRLVATVKDRQPRAKVILVSVFPRYESATHPFRAWAKALNAGIRPLADGERVRWLDFGDRFLAADGTLPKAMFPDGTHPNADGYAIWYEELSRVLAELIPEGGSARQKAIPTAKCETEIVRRIASVGGPARDYAADPAFVAKFREGAIAIAKRKMAEVDEGVRTHPTVVPTGRRLATGGQFGGFFLWDSAFSVLWARYLDEKEFPVHSTLDNFYALATPSGFIPREYTPEGNPCWTEAHPISFSAPLLSWAEVELFRMGKSDKARLARVYPFLKRHHEACRRSFRRDDGLYFGDQIGCGMDDLVRWPKDLKPGEKASGGIAFTKAALGAKVQDWWTWLEEKKDDLSWNRQAGWIDLSCEVAFDCLNLAELAETVGRTDDAAAFRAEHASLVRVINEKCWDESRGFYFDVTDGGIVDRYMGCAYWALISKVATPARAKRMVEKLFDPRFFGRPVMVPSLAACEPDYDPEKGYWRGACWPPTTYMTILGLKSYGYVKEAEQVARRFYNANAELFVRTGTIWEDISPEQCHEPKARACRDFCGWSALAPIALPIEWNWTI